MSKLRLWPIERVRLDLTGVAGQSQNPQPHSAIQGEIGTDELWLCATKTANRSRGLDWVYLDIEGYRSTSIARVGTKIKLSDVRILDLAHLAKPCVVLLSQVWTEYTVRERSVSGRIANDDITGVRTKPRLIELAGLFPSFLGYVLLQPEFREVQAIKLPVNDGVYFVCRVPDGAVSLVINGIFEQGSN